MRGMDPEDFWKAGVYLNERTQRDKQLKEMEKQTQLLEEQAKAQKAAAEAELRKVKAELIRTKLTARHVAKPSESPKHKIEGGKFCHECGQAVQASDKFCVACGTQCRDSGATASQKQEEEKPAQRQGSLDVILVDVKEGSKISCIRALRKLKSNLGLMEAKELVESVPTPILLEVSKDVADVAYKRLKAAGAKVAVNDTSDTVEGPLDVILVDVKEGSKISCIRALRKLKSNLGLMEAKEFVEGVPEFVLKGVSKLDAEAAQDTLKKSGATVELQPSHLSDC